MTTSVNQMMANKAIERLRERAATRWPVPYWSEFDELLEGALAAERRATVERLNPWLVHDQRICDGVVCTCGLDEEAAR